MGIDLKRYERFGWDYEHLSPLTSEEIAWHMGFARVSGGPVLELACGTGRLMAQIAMAEFEVEGIDLSDHMLAMAKERIAGLPDEVASRMLVHKADMSAFDLSRRFGLVVIADNSFAVLNTEAQQQACLERIHLHLEDGGKLLVAVRRLNPDILQGSRLESGWSRPIYHPVTRNRVTRKVVHESVDNRTRIRTTLLYKTSGGGNETVEEFVSETMAMRTADYLALFSRLGFKPQAFSGYQGLADDGESPVLCFMCHKRV